MKEVQEKEGKEGPKSPKKGHKVGGTRACFFRLRAWFWWQGLAGAPGPASWLLVQPWRALQLAPRAPPATPHHLQQHSMSAASMPAPVRWLCALRHASAGSPPFPRRRSEGRT